MKKLTVILLAALLLAGCTQANPEQTTVPTTMPAVEPYAVYLSSGAEAEGLFTTDVETFVSPETDTASAFDYPARISLQIGSETVEMDYNRTGANSHWYQAENGLVRCQLNVDNGALTFLTIMDESLLTDFICEDAPSFENSAQQLISAYYNEDWTKYTVTCHTSMVLQGENYASGHTAEGFVTEENDSQKVSGYSLEFSRVIDGVATTDKIEVRFTFDTLMISFSNHAFDAVKEIPVDTARMEASVDAFLDTYVDTTKYTLQDYTLSNPKVTREGDRLYYAVSAEMTLGSKNGTGNIVSVVTLLTDLEADVAYAAVGTPVRPYQIIETAVTVPTRPAQEEIQLPAECLYTQNENFEAFVFDGAQPEFAAEEPIDISSLTQGSLYLYNKTEKRSILVTDQPVRGGSAIHLTAERLYYVLESDPKTVRQADLAGQELDAFCTDFIGEGIVSLCYFGTDPENGTMFISDNRGIIVYKKSEGYLQWKVKSPHYEYIDNIRLQYDATWNEIWLLYDYNSELCAQTHPIVFWD